MDDDTLSQDTHSRAPSRAVSQIAQYAGTARAIANAHARELLGWMWQWRVIDHHIVRRLLRVSRSSGYRILARLRRHGLIQPVVVSGTPASPWMLTPAGVNAISPYLDPDDLYLAPVTAPDRIRGGQVQHDLLAQHFALRIARNPPPKITSIIDAARAAAAENAYYSLPDPMIAIRSAAWLEAVGTKLGGKYSDAFVTTIIDATADVSVRVAIECQQTPEALSTVQRIMSGYCSALAEHAMDMLVYCGTRPNILPLYPAALSPGLQPWHKTASRRWVPDTGPSPSPYQEWMASRILTLASPELESWYYHLVLGR